MCEGDCDTDDDCTKSAGLYCFDRDGFESVPNCEGDGRRGSDYCTSTNGGAGRPAATTMDPPPTSEDFLDIGEDDEAPTSSPAPILGLARSSYGVFDRSGYSSLEDYPFLVG